MATVDVPSGFTYVVVPENGKRPEAQAKDIKAAEARPEHSDIIWLMQNNLIILDQKKKSHEFEIREMRTYPNGIGEKYARQLDSKPGRQARELFLSSVYGNAVFYVLADARNKVLIQLKAIAPVTEGLEPTPSMSAQMKHIRGDATAMEMIDEFDGIDLRDPKNVIHLTKKNVATTHWGVKKAK